MKIKVNIKQIFILFMIVLAIGISVKTYQYIKPVKTIYYHGFQFTFRDDVKKALEVPVYPNQEFLHDLFWDYKIKNVTILFKPSDSKTNALYRIQSFELAYKLTLVDKINTDAFRPKKTFNSEPIDSYENITREAGILKIILVAPEFTNETRVRGGGNKIYIYGKDSKDFDLATMRTILAVMNATIEDNVNIQ